MDSERPQYELKSAAPIANRTSPEQAYEIPADAHRGCHAHKTEQEFMVAFKYRAGSETVKFVPNPGWYIETFLWVLEFQLLG
jgi:hypothetical protein